MLAEKGDTSCCRIPVPGLHLGSHRSPAPARLVCRSTHSRLGTRPRRAQRLLRSLYLDYPWDRARPCVPDECLAARRLGPGDRHRHHARLRLRRSRLRRAARESFLATPGAKDVGVELSRCRRATGWPAGGSVRARERGDRLADRPAAGSRGSGIFRPIQEAGIARSPGRRTRSRSGARATRRGATGCSRRSPHVPRSSARARSSSGSGCPRASRRTGPRRARVALAPGEGFGRDRPRLGADLARDAGRAARFRARAARRRVRGALGLDPAAHRQHVAHELACLAVDPALAERAGPWLYAASARPTLPGSAGTGDGCRRRRSGCSRRSSAGRDGRSGPPGHTTTSPASPASRRARQSGDDALLPAGLDPRERADEPRAHGVHAGPVVELRLDVRPLRGPDRPLAATPPPSARLVAGPATASADSPCRRWKRLSARPVSLPK